MTYKAVLQNDKWHVSKMQDIAAQDDHEGNRLLISNGCTIVYVANWENFRRDIIGERNEILTPMEDENAPA